jgi:beta-lactamase superfamily II metal-dependent hydrolase
MPRPAITLEVLPAAYGDSLLISCPVGNRIWRLLVDTGPDECWPQLQARLQAIAPDSRGQRRIDLAVISHIDHDHIGGARLLLSDQTLGLSWGDVWFNAPASKGVAEGQGLAALLGTAASKLPWNLAFAGKAAVTGGEGAFLELPAKKGYPKITLLSPTPLRLGKLFAVWDRELALLDKSSPATASRAALRDLASADLAALAATKTSNDNAPANGSAISFLLEHRGASLLLCADAFPTVLAPALRALAQQRKLAGALQVNAIKLSHHGSKANTNADFLAAVQAQHYVVSTNGALFDHPDDEALARVLMQAPKPATLWFNHDNARNRRWADAALQARHGYSAVLPASAGAGVTLTLP